MIAICGSSSWKYIHSYCHQHLVAQNDSMCIVSAAVLHASCWSWTLCVGDWS